MIVPNRNYRVDIEFDRVSNRWVARFHSKAPEGISFAFPLPDYYEDQNSVVLDEVVEDLLSLTFQQMVSVALQDMASRQQMFQAPISATEAELAN